MKIEKKIRRIRELKAYSQDYMAIMLDISQSKYSRIENGSTSVSFKDLVRISQIFEIELMELIKFDEEVFIPKSKRLICNNDVIIMEQRLSELESQLKMVRNRLG